MTELWTYSVGMIPFKVTAYERLTRQGVVYLRWRSRGNWRNKSLGFRVRDTNGRLLPEMITKAQARAGLQLDRLLNATPGAARPLPPLTLREGLDRYADPVLGQFPTETPYLKEVRRSLEWVIRLLGEEFPWLALKAQEFRQIGRRRIQELRTKGAEGYRGAEVVLARLLAVAQWLRDEERIPADAAVAPSTWRERLRQDWRELSAAVHDYRPARPRHTPEDRCTLVEASRTVDPRMHLLLELGADLRLGQVERCRRSQLDLGKAQLEVRGRGSKRGTKILLTAGQLDAVKDALTTGFLRELEQAGGDYPLFPAGQFPGGRSGDPHAVERHRTAKPAHRRTIGRWFEKSEKLAGIAHVPGRGAYGLRRLGTDQASEQGISPEALQEYGGWSDSQVPMEVYRERERRKAMEEARDVRAQVRGEKGEGNA